MSAASPTTFFSYARADSAFVLRLARDLRAAGEKVWVDQLDIRGGERWDRAIETALEQAGSLLVILSPTSVESQNVMDEVSLALESDKRVIPVLLSECKLPFRLRRLQFVDFSGDYDAAFVRLCAALGDSGGAVPAAPIETPPAPSIVPQPAPRSTVVRPGAGDGPPPVPAAPTSRTPLIVGAVATLALTLLAFLFWPRSTPVVEPTVPPPTRLERTPATLAGRVFIHTPDMPVGPAIGVIAAALKAQGFEVPDPRPVKPGLSTGDVRFFYPQDRATAMAIKQTVEQALASRGVMLTMSMVERDGSKFPGSAPGKLEVWLPSLVN